MSESKGAARTRLAQLGISPRGLSAAEAAAYCGISEGSFRSRVRDGKLPRPIPHLNRWDKKALDRHIDGEPAELVDPLLEAIRGPAHTA